ncbi:TonB-dependent receptor [Marinomonas sp.]|nr:TonB-dependent receptor [Marinomonas sp.]MDB4837196.1 TonB-dependent receptor [Marinomonas sp.]
MANTNRLHAINNKARLSVVALSVIAINSMMISAAHAESVQLDTVIITGEKIDKSLKDTTTAVTVISEDELAKGDIKNTKELATQAPNVVTDSFDNISIRGISGGGAANGGAALVTGARARVSTVVDGTTQDWSGYNFNPVSLWDVEQVEILRGPQSTTQGASAIGGALVVNTNNPSFEREAAVRAGLESYENGNLKYNLAAMSSGAIIDDELAYRIAVDKTQGEGWLNYDTSDYSGDLPNLSESDSLNVRAKLLWQPASIPELSAKLTMIRLDNEGEHASFASNNDDSIASQTLIVADSGGSISRYQDSTDNTISADIDYQINSGITNSLHISNNESDTYADGYGLGTSVYTYDIQQETTALENRILFNQENSKLTGVIGFFISEKDSTVDATQNLDIDTTYTTETTALYGESSYALSPKTHIITGLRIENEDIDKSNTLLSIDETSKLEETYTLPKLALTHAISNATTLGASISKGYSPGGTGIDFTTFSVTEYDSEEVTSFELSSKSDFAEGTTLKTSFFYNNYSDYQALSSFTLVNIDKATTYGVEVEAATWLGEDLELWGAIGLLQGEVNKYETNTSYEDNDLSSAPESNISLGFTQYIGTDWSISTDATYVGEYYSDLANSDTAIVGGHTIINAGAQYTLGDLTINAYIKNLTDEDTVYYRSGALATVGQTRTFGINAVYRM